MLAKLKNQKMPSKIFLQFLDLSNDLQLHVFSFVAEAPFDFPADAIDIPRSIYHGTLTHVLPLISSHFFNLLTKSAESDFLWRESLRRRLLNESYSWCEGVVRLIRKWKSNNSSEKYLEQKKNHKFDSIDELIDFACEALINFQSQISINSYFIFSKDRIHYHLFQKIVTDYIRVKNTPVFCMHGDVRLNHVIGLHFFEPRYRIMMVELMSNQSPEHCRGEPLSNENEPFPQFIYANTSLAYSSPATIVEVRQCFMHPDGRADVFLMPVANVWIEKHWVRIGTKGLHVANAVRMNEKASLFREHATNVLFSPYRDEFIQSLQE